MRTWLPAETYALRCTVLAGLQRHHNEQKSLGPRSLLVAGSSVHRRHNCVPLSVSQREGYVLLSTGPLPPRSARPSVHARVTCIQSSFLEATPIVEQAAPFMLPKDINSLSVFNSCGGCSIFFSSSLSPVETQANSSRPPHIFILGTLQFSCEYLP